MSRHTNTSMKYVIILSIVCWFIQNNFLVIAESSYMKKRFKSMIKENIEVNHFTSYRSLQPSLSVTLWRLRQFFSPPQLLTLYRGHFRPCMEYAFYVCVGKGFQSYCSPEQGGVKSFSFHQFPPLTQSSISQTTPQCCISCYLLPLFF